MPKPIESLTGSDAAAFRAAIKPHVLDALSPDESSASIGTASGRTAQDHFDTMGWLAPTALTSALARALATNRELVTADGETDDTTAIVAWETAAAAYSAGATRSIQTPPLVLGPRAYAVGSFSKKSFRLSGQGPDNTKAIFNGTAAADFITQDTIVGRNSAAVMRDLSIDGVNCGVIYRIPRNVSPNYLSFVGSITGNVLTIESMEAGKSLFTPTGLVGKNIIAPGFGTAQIIDPGTGTGREGTYILSDSFTVPSGTAMTATGANYGCDDRMQICNVRFYRGQTQIYIDGYVNAHFDRLRFDNWNTEALLTRPQANQALSSFHLSNFTSDNASGGSTAQARRFHLLDLRSCATSANIGIKKFSSGRIEFNQVPLVGEKAVFHSTTKSGGTRQVEYVLSALTIQNSVTVGSGIASISGTTMTVLHSCQCTGSISGDVLTLDTIISGAVIVGATIGTGAAAGTKILSNASDGVSTGQGGTGTYKVDISQTIASGTTFTLNVFYKGFAADDVLTGTGVLAGQTIVAQLTGETGGAGTYQVSQSQTLAATGVSTRGVNGLFSRDAGGSLSADRYSIRSLQMSGIGAMFIGNYPAWMKSIPTGNWSELLGDPINGFRGRRTVSSGATGDEYMPPASNVVCWQVQVPGEAYPRFVMRGDVLLAGDGTVTPPVLLRAGAKTGYASPPTGTLSRATFATYTAPTLQTISAYTVQSFGAAYDQTKINALDTAHKTLRDEVAALKVQLDAAVTALQTASRFSGALGNDLHVNGSSSGAGLLRA